MGMRALVAGSAALTAVLMAAAGAVTATPVTAPAARTARTGPPRAVTVALTAEDEDADASPRLRVRVGICTTPPAYRALAARLSAGIEAGLQGRAGHHGVTAYDTVTKVSCYTGSTRHFDAASVVKVIILAALLRWHQETGRALTSWEKEKTRLMITRSDNGAATALWNEVGLRRLQHLLDLAKMGQTRLDRYGYWGLSQLTAHDEMLLLEVLALPNPVLTASSRSYALGLMARVIAGQRWGTPAGAPARITVHVKNGWLPDDTGWHINSIGVFTGKGRNYLIAVLSDDNPSEQYGIRTIERVARPVHQALNAAVGAAGGAQASLAATEGLGSTPAPDH